MVTARLAQASPEFRLVRQRFAIRNICVSCFPNILFTTYASFGLTLGEVLTVNNSRCLNLGGGHLIGEGRKHLFYYIVTSNTCDTDNDVNKS